MPRQKCRVLSPPGEREQDGRPNSPPPRESGSLPPVRADYTTVLQRQGIRGQGTASPRLGGRPYWPPCGLEARTPGSPPWPSSKLSCREPLEGEGGPQGRVRARTDGLKRAIGIICITRWQRGIEGDFSATNAGAGEDRCGLCGAGPSHLFLTHPRPAFVFSHYRLQ